MADDKSNLPMDGDKPPISQQPAGYYPAAPPMPTTNLPPPNQPPSYNPPPGQAPASYNPPPGQPPASYNPAMNNPVMNQPASYGGPPPGLPPPTLHQPPSVSPVSVQPTALHGLGSLGVQQQVEWMMPPPPSPSCPPGLECLTVLDQVSMAQQVNLIELIRAIDMANRYDVKNRFGQQVFLLQEDRMLMECCRCFDQNFHLRGYDGNNQEVLHLSKPFRCPCCCCFPCICDCLEDMKIEAPMGNVIGSAVQVARIGPKLEIMDSANNKIFSVSGPFGCCPCYGVNANYPFQVTDQNGQSVGSIIKYWAGGVVAIAAQDCLEINFPMDLDVTKKALLMATGVLLDYMLFQRQQPQNRRN